MTARYSRESGLTCALYLQSRISTSVLAVFRRFLGLCRDSGVEMERWQPDYCRKINQTTMSHTLQNCDLTGQRRHFNVSLRTQRFAFKVNEKKKYFSYTLPKFWPTILLLVLECGGVYMKKKILFRLARPSSFGSVAMSQNCDRTLKKMYL